MDMYLRNLDKGLRFKYNEVVLTYDKMRPTYVKELFDDVIQFSSLDSSKKALEVGIGTGQATLPFLKTGCKVTAIELGEALANFSKEKFSEFNNFDVINKDFESVVVKNNTYDLFYSASAFHWIPQEIGYPKVFQLLKSGGVLALFFIRPFPASETDTVHIAIQKVYSNYMPSSEKPQRFNEEECLGIVNTIKQYGFIDANFKLYHNTRTFDAKSYASLISTYSDHRAMQEDKRALFEKEIIDAIDSCGGEFILYDTIDLYLAKKP